MNARSRQARQTIRNRTRSQRAATRIARRGTGTLTTHCLAAGLTPRQARTVASSLRRNATKAGIQGTPARTHAAGRMRDSTRYTARQVALICLQYKPRKRTYRLAANKLALAT